MKKHLIFAVAAMAMLLVGAARAEMVDNPGYVSWAKHKPGTSVTLQQAMSMQGMNMTHDITQTLVEITPEKAVVEYAVVMDMGGVKHENKQKQDIPAKVEKGYEIVPKEMKGSAKEVGTETLQIAGKSYECKVVEFTGEGPQGKVTGKIWSTDQIPGGMAKNVTEMESPQKMNMTMTVTKIETK